MGEKGFWVVFSFISFSQKKNLKKISQIEKAHFLQTIKLLIQFINIILFISFSHLFENGSIFVKDSLPFLGSSVLLLVIQDQQQQLRDGGWGRVVVENNFCLCGLYACG